MGREGTGADLVQDTVDLDGIAVFGVGIEAGGPEPDHSSRLVGRFDPRRIGEVGVGGDGEAHRSVPVARVCPDLAARGGDGAGPHPFHGRVGLLDDRGFGMRGSPQAVVGRLADDVPADGQDTDRSDPRLWRRDRSVRRC